MSDVVGADEREFLDACKHGHMDVIDRLIDKVDINCCDEYTGLMLACKNNEPWGIDVVQKLLAHGIDVDIENKYYCNALDYVLGQAKFNKELTALLLFCSKLGINRLDGRGRNYLWSCSSSSGESVSFLIENGIDINHVDGNCLTYLDVCGPHHKPILLAAGGQTLQ